MDMNTEKVIDLAFSQVGYLEKRSNENLDDNIVNAGINNYTKYARDLDAANVFNVKVQGMAWCATFYFWLFLKSFGKETAMNVLRVKPGYNVASCSSMVANYKSHSMFKDTPKVGDQIFFNGLRKTSAGNYAVDKTNYAHTGIVVDIRDGNIYTVEGNTSSQSQVVPNGGGVFAKMYQISNYRIAGYGRPDWAQIKDYGAGADWSYDARKWAVDSGLILGGSDGYDWTGELTREQLVTILFRFSQNNDLK